MLFDDAESAEAYMQQHKPPFGLRWACADYHMEGKKSISVMAVERWPIDHLDLTIVDPGPTTEDQRI